MIVKIGFNNFKAFGPKMQYFSKKPITLIYGPNSVGKSSLLHAQLYLEYIKGYPGSDVFKTSFAGDEIDFGGFQNIVHKHVLSESIVYEEIYSDYRSFIELAQNEEGKITTKVRVFIDDEELFCFTRETQGIEINTAHKALDRFSDIHVDFKLILDHILDTKRIQYYGPLRHYPERFEMFTIKQSSSNIEEAHSFTPTGFTKFIVKVGRTLTTVNEKLFSSGSYFSIPLNIIYKCIIIFSVIASKNFRTFMTSDDDLLDIWNKWLPRKLKFLRRTKFDSIEVWKKLMNSVEIQEKINAWLGDNKKLKSNYRIHVNEQDINSRGVLVRLWHKLWGIEEYSAFFKQFKQKESHWEDNLENVIDFIFTGVDKILRIKPKYEQQLVFTDISKNTEVTPRDMGLGISQALPILISTFGSKHANIYLEQPELHLHPAVQMELMDEFIRSMRENENTFFIESHSEHMLLRVMKRMRQTADGTLQDESLKLTPDDVCLLYVDNDGESTYLQELRLSPKGTLLDHWPHGFFEEGYKERFS